MSDPEAWQEVKRLRDERDAALAELIFARQTVFQLRTKLAACCRTPADGKHTAAGETFIPEAL